MTIYKPKPADRKADSQKSPLKAAVVIDDVRPLTAKPGIVRPAAANVRVIEARRRRSALLLGVCLLIIFVIIAVTFIGGFFLYQRLAKKLHHQHIETAEVKYFEYQKSDGMSTGERKRINMGSFIEKIEFVDEDNAYEKLDVPPILDSRRSTVVHDFEKNMTAIVDRDMRRCFVMPLNRTAVQPPRNFMDLLIKYKSGYYVPDAEVVRDNYKVQLPAVQNLEPFGFYIWFDCRYFATYRLVHDDVEPRILSKRSACEQAGESYCLGSAGTSQMTCFKLTGCSE